METTQPTQQPDNGCQEAYKHYAANNAYGFSEFMEQGFKSGYDVGYNKGYQEAVRIYDQSRGDYKERVKHYFISFSGATESGNTLTGCSIYTLKNKSLQEISEWIKTQNNLRSLPVILNLRELSKDEFEMLNPQISQQ